MASSMTTYGRLALEVFRRAGLRGVPVYASFRRPYYLRVETASGSSVYRVAVLEDIESDERYLAVRFSTGYGEVIIGKLQGEYLAEEYPWMVPKAVALNILMMSNFESDIWSKRVYWYEKGHMRPYLVDGEFAIYKHSEWDCYAVEVRSAGVVVGWRNTLIGRTDCSGEWIRRWDPTVSREKILEACERLGGVGVGD